MEAAVSKFVYCHMECVSVFHVSLSNSLEKINLLPNVKNPLVLLCVIVDKDEI